MSFPPVPLPPISSFVYKYEVSSIKKSFIAEHNTDLMRILLHFSKHPVADQPKRASTRVNTSDNVQSPGVQADSGKLKPPSRGQYLDVFPVTA
ncbi:unnamed protein product [Schistosoma mattheei]|uniref:Uncharacterized protein n=1 Tax=Schistosoma mattheei TaxID=31246 RepID=A0A183PCL9_9TREM|nr:unnamed protein product [Schistosoma mattheei]